MSKHRISFSLTETEFQLVTDQAKARHKSKSAMARDILIEYLKRHPAITLEEAIKNNNEKAKKRLQRAERRAKGK